MSTEQIRKMEREENKDRRMQTILDAGKNLFMEKGLANVNMKAIAEKAQVSRATLYRYYPSKEDLAMAIERHLFLDILLPTYRDLIKKAKGNGIEKLEHYLKMVFTTYKAYPDFYKFTGAFDHYFSYNQEPQKLAKEMKQIFQTGSNVHPLVSFIKQGMVDKSIRSDIDPDITALTIDQTLLSLGQRIAARKEEMRYEYGIEKPDNMIETLITTILRGIKRRP